jgi:hypothetical protein
VDPFFFLWNSDARDLSIYRKQSLHQEDVSYCVVRCTPRHEDPINDQLLYQYLSNFLGHLEPDNSVQRVFSDKLTCMKFKEHAQHLKHYLEDLLFLLPSRKLESQQRVLPATHKTSLNQRRPTTS